MRDNQGCEAQPDGRGLSGEVRQNHKGVGDAVKPLAAEVVLAEPDSIEAGLLDGTGLLGKLVQDLVVGYLEFGVVEYGEEAEFQWNAPLKTALLESQISIGVWNRP